MPATKGLVGVAYTTKSLVNIPDAYHDDRFNPEVDLKTGYRTKSVLCYPILNSEDEVTLCVRPPRNAPTQRPHATPPRNAPTSRDHCHGCESYRDSS